MEVIVVGGKGGLRTFKTLDECKEVKADVIIDLKGECEDINARLIITVNPKGLVEPIERGVRRILIGGTSLRALIGLGVLNGNQIFAHDENGRAVGVMAGNTGVLYARPLSMYLVHYPRALLDELRIILSRLGDHEVDLGRVIDEIVGIVLDERRSKRISKTLALLEMAIQEGVSTEFPAYIADLLERAGVIENGRINRELLARIVEEVKARVYPSSHA